MSIRTGVIFFLMGDTVDLRLSPTVACSAGCMFPLLPGRRV